VQVNSAAHILGATDVKHPVFTCDDVNEYATRMSCRWLNMWQIARFHRGILIGRKPFDKLRAFDAALATEWLAMSKA